MPTLNERTAILEAAYPFSTYDALCRRALAGEDGRMKDEDRKPIVLAVVALIERMRDDGDLRSIPGAQGHRIRLVDHLDHVVAGRDGTDWDARHHIESVAETIAVGFLIRRMVGAVHDARKDGDADALIAATYQDLIASLAAGSTRDAFELMDDHYCSVTDERYRLTLKDWQFSLQRFDMKTRRHVEIAPIEPMQVKHLEIEFKTPDILVADFIRLPGMKEWLGETDYSKPSINSDLGVEQAIERYAKQNGMVHVNVGNTSPSLLKVDGALVLANVDPDEDLPSGVERLGDTCTDLWAVTMVERAVVERVVAEYQGIAVEDASAMVDAYKQDTYGVTEIRVEPGVKHLYFMGDHEQFAERFRSPDLEIDVATLQPAFILSDRELALVDGLESGPRP